MRTSVVLLLLLAGAGAAPAQRVIVASPAGPGVQQAVRMARAGDTVVVSEGVYAEPTIVIDRPLVLVGRGRAILDGANATHILRVVANDVTVRDLAFRNGQLSHVEDRAAIHVGDVRRCRIEHNTITDAFFGIYLARTTGCVIRGNVLAGRPARSEDGAGNGIHLWTAQAVEVSDNRITGHRDGIYLEFAHQVQARRNVSERNLRYGLHFMFSDDCAYEDNTFRANQAGVAVMYTKRVAMTRNRFEDNWGAAAYGLLLKEIYDSRITGNVFAHNSTALLADGATRLQAHDNRFTDNGWAIKLMTSTEQASFTGNVFAGNSFDVATNSRGNSNSLRGNYWDTYDGYDMDRNGIGDVPHRPVRLFSLLVERSEPTMIMLRSPLIALLDRAERLIPSLTPETLMDAAPLMRRPR